MNFLHVISVVAIFVYLCAVWSKSNLLCSYRCLVELTFVLYGWVHVYSGYFAQNRSESISGQVNLNPKNTKSTMMTSQSGIFVHYCMCRLSLFYWWLYWGLILCILLMKLVPNNDCITINVLLSITRHNMPKHTGIQRVMSDYAYVWTSALFVPTYAKQCMS